MLFRSQIHQDRAGFEYRRLAAIFMIDNRWDPAIGADLDKAGRELFALVDIDRDHSVIEPAFLKHDRNLLPVGRRPCIKVYHLTK